MVRFIHAINVVLGLVCIKLACPI